MHRTSRILALTTLLLPQAPPCFTKAAALPRQGSLSGAFCWPWRFLPPAEKRCFRSGLHFLLSALGDAAGAKGLFIPQMLFFALAHGAYIRYFLCAGGLPARPAAWLLPAALLALLFAGVVPRVLIRPNGSASPFTVRSSPGCFYSVLRYRGAYAALVPLRGPAVRFFPTA